MYKNKEKEKAYKKKYREENKEKLRETSHNYWIENKEEIKAKDKKYREENKDEIKVKNKRYREENKEKIASHKLAVKESDRAHNILKIYGLEKKEYDEMLKKQNGKCAICGKDSVRKNRNIALCVDHDHKTGRIRGILCTKCNNALAFATDNIEILQKASIYLLENNEISAIIEILESGNNSMVEPLPSKQVVEGSNPFSRSSIVSP